LVEIEDADMASREFGPLGAHGEIDQFQSPPSRSQIDTAQDRMNRLQRLLNRVQTETDAWSDEKEAV
jgi:hypothetical protein